ncbi:MAG: sigma-70 family RNA polymerase sigma factor [Planctomycetota bacterium]|nr:sigma-70 family RNA polymerase sigma factor [Planctomycetota bacterium]
MSDSSAIHTTQGRALDPDAHHPGHVDTHALDSHLLARCAQGDRQAFLNLYDRYRARAYGQIVALLGAGPHADDALQDAMWEVWRRAHSYNPALGRPDVWILMLTRSKAIDVLRRERRLRPFDTAHLSARDGPATEHPLHTREQAQRCDALLALLPAEQSAVIRLAYIRGLTRDQIASTLGIPVGTVKTRIRAGVRALAERMSADRSGREHAP